MSLDGVVLRVFDSSDSCLEGRYPELRGRD